MKNMKKDLIAYALTGTVLLLLVGCSLFTDGSIGLSTYYDDVQANTPVNWTAALSRSLADAEDLAVNTVFSEDPEAVTSLKTGVDQLDELIEQLNESVNSYDEGTDGVTVTPVSAGEVELPFFGDTVEVTHEVRLSENKWAAYKKAETVETVVLFNTYDYTWDFPDPDVEATDHYIFYGTRDSATNEVSIKFALYADNQADDSFVKDWVCEIWFDGDTNDFQIRAAWGDGVGSGGGFITSLACSGNAGSDGTFGLKYQESTDTDTGTPEVYVFDADFTEVTGADTTQVEALALYTAADMPRNHPFTAKW